MKRIPTYNCKHIEMLLAALVILNNLRNHLRELGAFRKEWTLEYVDGFINKIKETMRTYLGIDYRSDLRQATTKVEEVMIDVHRDLHRFKVQVENDFNKTEAIEILTQMGFPRYYKNGRKTDQENLMNLLYGIQNVMKDGMKERLISKGSNEQIIDNLIGYAPKLEQANIEQEQEKVTWHLPSKEAATEFQKIYEEMIKIAKLCYAYYAGDPVKQSLFSFSRVVRNLRTNHVRDEEEPQAET